MAETVRDWAAVTTFADDGIRRPGRRHADGTVAVDTRAGWAGDDRAWNEQCEAYFEADPAPRPDALPANGVESTTTVAAVESEHGVDPDKEDVPRGGTVAGNERLSAFLERVRDYPSVVSSPAAAAERSPRLSPYLAFGALSTRQVYQRLGEMPESRGASMFRSRLYWNRHNTAIEYNDV